MSIEYWLAWLLPLFCGTGVCALVARRWGRWSDLSATLGSGWIVGVLAAAAAARIVGYDDTLHAFPNAAPWLAALGAAAWAIVAASLVVRRGRGFVPAVQGEPSPASRAARLGWWLLFAAIVLRLLVLADEASLRPVFPWDAWSAWALKPKSWMLLGHVEPYVSMHDWLANPHAATRTAGTWFYPEFVPWMEIWFASAAGGWNEPLVNLAWCGALAALALAGYGTWRRLGLSAWLAMLLVYLLVSLPLVDAHVALAGYADLWVAAILGVAAFAWTRWLTDRSPAHWVLAVLLALCLPLVKLEGLIWAGLFLVVVLLERLPARWRGWVVAVVMVSCVACLAFGVRIPAPGFGWIELSWSRIAIADVQVYELDWHPVGDALFASLFALPNWHLLWYALPLLVFVRRERLRVDPAARFAGLLVLLQVLFLAGLFFLTKASAWAQDYTSANRLIMQMVPCVFAFAALLLRPRSSASA